MKTVPAFDSKDVAGNGASGENDEFGDESGSSINFTEYSSKKNGTQLTQQNVRELIFAQSYGSDRAIWGGSCSTLVYSSWCNDRDTSFSIPLNLALKLQKEGKNVNYLLAWNRPHSGDYSLDELFSWIKSIIK